MSPSEISEDAVVHGQNIAFFEGVRFAPPAYEDHKHDVIPMEWT